MAVCVGRGVLDGATVAGGSGVEEAVTGAQLPMTKVRSRREMRRLVMVSLSNSLGG